MEIEEQLYIKFCKGACEKFLDLSSIAPCVPSDEKFKMLFKMKFHNRSSGYTSFIQTFALFSSSFEVSIQRSPVLRAFNDINTEHKFKQLKLPTKLTEMNGLKIYEIDLS